MLGELAKLSLCWAVLRVHRAARDVRAIVDDEVELAPCPEAVQPRLHTTEEVQIGLIAAEERRALAHRPLELVKVYRAPAVADRKDLVVCWEEALPQYIGRV
jgi:hypothetical protein